MCADKYASIFSRLMKAIVYLFRVFHEILRKFYEIFGASIKDFQKHVHFFFSRSTVENKFRLVPTSQNSLHSFLPRKYLVTSHVCDLANQ